MDLKTAFIVRDGSDCMMHATTCAVAWCKNQTHHPPLRAARSFLHTTHAQFCCRVEHPMQAPRTPCTVSVYWHFVLACAFSCVRHTKDLLLHLCWTRTFFPHCVAVSLGAPPRQSTGACFHSNTRVMRSVASLGAPPRQLRHCLCRQ